MCKCYVHIYTCVSVSTYVRKYFCLVLPERNRGRQLRSKKRKTSCHMYCRNSNCTNAFIARKKRGLEGIRWVVKCAPRCTCPPLSEAEKRRRNVKTSLLSDQVKEAIKNTVASNKHTSKVRQVADKVQALTGERIKPAQCRCAFLRPFLARIVLE